MQQPCGVSFYKNFFSYHDLCRTLSKLRATFEFQGTFSQFFFHSRHLNTVGIPIALHMGPQKHVHPE